jgi:PAS domain S-box-containing protein
MIIDEDHRIILANTAVRTDIGVEPEAIVGKFCPQVIHGRDEPYQGCPLEEAVAKGHSVVKEMFFEEYQKWYKSGAYVTNIKTKDGKRIYIHLIHDIDDRKRAETNLINKVEELEKWQRLTVSREIKMADLKKEVNSLRDLLKKYEKSNQL